jgi:hypothetical protein
MKTETVNEFMERIYVNFSLDKVSIWPSKTNKEKGYPHTESWDIQTAKNYIEWIGGDEEE